MLPLRTASAAALLLLLAGCGEDPAPVADDPATEQRSDNPSGAGKSPTSPEEAAETAETSTGASRTAAVYYVGDTERAGPRLYREFRRGEGDALGAALQLLTESPLDPDYRTLWQPGQLVAASYDGDVVNVEVDPAVRRRPPGMGKAEAAAAVEQVVYTVQGAVQERAPVQFRTADNPIDRVFGVPTSEPVANGPVLQVLSHVSLTSPEQGATVSGGSLTVSGVGNSFEANLGWEIRRGGAVVEDGFATMAGWMGDKLYPFEVDVDISDLEPGDYTFWVTTDDPTGGTEGVGAMTDDKRFTIR